MSDTQANYDFDAPLVTMVVPCYNHEQYVQSCLASIIKQDYQNIELIVIDDGSADESVERIQAMVAACEQRFVRFEFRHRPNKGLAATLNEAIQWARGTFFATIASDDLLLERKTSTLVRSLVAETDVAGAFAGCETIDEEGLITGTLRPSARYYSFSEVITHRYVILAPTQLLRLDAIREVGCYRPDVYIEDWYMWLALTSRGYRLKVVPDVLVQYRLHDTNMSKNALRRYESSRSILEPYKKHPLYEEALAELHLAAALNTWTESRSRSFRYLSRAYASHWRIGLSTRFWTTCARLVLPVWFVRTLSVAKARIRMRPGAVRSSW